MGGGRGKRIVVRVAVFVAALMLCAVAVLAYEVVKKRSDGCAGWSCKRKDGAIGQQQLVPE
jgi:hypothetical protein